MANNPKNPPPTIPPGKPASGKPNDNPKKTIPPKKN